jgi:hypothetical protein
MLRSEPNLRDVARGICRNKGGSEARPKPEVAETSRAESLDFPHLPIDKAARLAYRQRW